MSFRRRSDIVGTTVPGRTVVPGRGPPVGGIPGRGAAPVRPMGRTTETASPLQHPGVKPSVITSIPTVSTGSADMDRVLGHDGLPLGQSLLLEENGTTDFTTTLLKLFVSQGIVHNRLEKTPNTHAVVIGPDQTWGKSLPGLYKGSSREQKKMAIKENESEISVANLTDSGTAQRDMRIAWRYSGKDKPKTDETTSSSYPDYTSVFDITSSLIPSPSAAEVTYLTVTSSFAPVIKQLEQIVQKNSDKVVRVVIPSLLNPAFFDLSLCRGAVSFLYQLRALLRKNLRNMVIAVSLNLDLFPRDTQLTSMAERLLDGVIELRPFEPELYEYMERVYKNQPMKIKHGHLNILKLPILSDLGMMCVKEMEYSFKNGRKRFEIEEWSIPVEEEEEEKQTTTNIEF